MNYIRSFLILFRIISAVLLFSCTSNPNEKMDSSKKQQSIYINSEEYKRYIVFKTHSIESIKKEVKDFIRMEQLDTAVSYKLYKDDDWYILELSPTVNMLIYFNLVGVITAQSDYSLPCIGVSLHKQNDEKDYYIVYHSVVYPQDKNYENIYGYSNSYGAFSVNSFNVSESLESSVILDSTINLTSPTKTYLEKVGFNYSMLIELDTIPQEEISI